ncbi:hypothetical protein J2T12_004533 [Paenibacillus anaericanus]|nr:hypothetical protein [Paenibacillus anaericanus]
MKITGISPVNEIYRPLCDNLTGIYPSDLVLGSNNLRIQ